MKHKHLFSLLDQSSTTVRVSFDNEYVAEDYDGFSRPPIRKDGKRRPKTYAYKVPKAWNVEENDTLVVNGVHGLALAHVVSVDGEPDIDIDADYDYKWAVQKVDMTEHNELVSREKNFQDTMLNVERVKQRESLLQSFRESLPEGTEARRLFEQTTASIAAPTVEAPANWAPPAAPETAESE